MNPEGCPPRAVRARSSKHDTRRAGIPKHEIPNSKQIALFCTESRRPGGGRQLAGPCPLNPDPWAIGFVFHARQTAPNAIAPFLASVCHSHRPRPIGFVSYVWLPFVATPQGVISLHPCGCIVPGPARRIGFVLHNRHPTGMPERWKGRVRPIGFVLHVPLPSRAPHATRVRPEYGGDPCGSL